MSTLIALGIGTGICCGIWAAISAIPGLGLVTWIGFAGCTAYFASGKHGVEGMKTAVFSTFSGLISAIVAMFISGLAPNVVVLSFLMTGIISATMCFQAKAKALWFIPGAFMGCFTSFGAASMGLNLFGPDIIRVITSLLCGAVLAFSCDKLGDLIFKKFGKPEIV
ncbi:DUF1097 domain-containing protein [Peptostreptococcus equinus]|uniref:DUF1097 domain-containing protein n=1 Tax=Peptostreptococcus equinus TaxID=3003601 RepID=A0ABY7JR57_9FIRM|nr:DUF1097 domain-containing protein [Peptostreptococcus sp. CBA3647]WAW14432.1 DUF1097 domain-containing protein [Peptostreptococcus sp. CBA3647]